MFQSLLCYGLSHSIFPYTRIYSTMPIKTKVPVQFWKSNPAYLQSLSPAWLEVRVAIRFHTLECVCACRFMAQEKIQAREREKKKTTFLFACLKAPSGV